MRAALGRVMVEIGEEIGSYVIEASIGEGGMGQVYLGRHKLIGRQAAIKILLPELCHRSDIVNRFFNEAKAATAIRHPGIVEVYDFGYGDDGSAFIVMEYLPGDSLEKLLTRRGVFSMHEAIDYAAQIANALTAAHDAGIIHRDLKPDNVLLQPDPITSSERTKIVDFGIAKLSSQEGVGSKTGTGVIMGSPVYMSPEQCRGAGAVDHRADLYSLGCMLFRFVCGRPPFDAEGTGEVLASHIYAEPPSPRSIVESVPVEMEQLILRLLAKDPEQRYGSAREVHDALRAIGAETAPSEAPAWVPSTPLHGTLLGTGSQPPVLQRSGTAGSVPPRVSTPPAVVSETNVPTEQKTTLGAAAEGLAGVADAARGGRSSLAMWAGGAVLAGVVVAMMVRGGGDGDSSGGASKSVAASQPAASQQESEAPEGQAEVGATTSGAPPAAATDIPEKADARAGNTNDREGAAVKPESVRISIVTEPKGAAVYQQPAGLRIGTTPVDISRVPQQGELEFLLVKSGYKRRTLLVRADRSEVYTETLERQRSAARAPRSVPQVQVPKKPRPRGTGDRTVDPFAP